jgi:hypothetical protein
MILILDIEILHNTENYQPRSYPNADKIRAALQIRPATAMVESSGLARRNIVMAIAPVVEALFKR